jgi:hypothetical protein
VCQSSHNANQHPTYSTLLLLLLLHGPRFADTNTKREEGRKVQIDNIIAGKVCDSEYCRFYLFANATVGVLNLEFE